MNHEERENVINLLQRTDLLLSEALSLISLVAEPMGDAERSQTLRPRTEFTAVAETLLVVAAKHADLAQLSEFDPTTVKLNLELTRATASLVNTVTELDQRLKDARLRWMGEAWRQSLNLYAAAKSCERVDPTMRRITEPLASTFASGRKKRPAPTE